MAGIEFKYKDELGFINIEYDKEKRSDIKHEVYKSEDSDYTGGVVWKAFSADSQKVRFSMDTDVILMQITHDKKIDIEGRAVGIGLMLFIPKHKAIVLRDYINAFLETLK